MRSSTWPEISVNLPVRASLRRQGMAANRGMAVGHLETSGAFKKNHAALANRLEGIASSLFPGRHLTVGDDSERVLTDRASTVSVSRGERPGLSRTASRARLAY